MKNSKHYLLQTFLVKIVFICSLCLGLNNQVIAQGEFRKINAYASLGAVPGFEALINVEILVKDGGYLTWYGRAGLGYAGILLGNDGPGALAAMTMLTGKKNNHFEVSGGAFIGYDNYYDDAFVLPSLDLGYRFQKPGGGFIFKAKAGILGAGVGLGYAF